MAKILDNYKFGGILADDMGLGKTIQILAIILNYIEETKKKKQNQLTKRNRKQKYIQYRKTKERKKQV